MNNLDRPYRVNEGVVRGVALQVLLLAVTALITDNIIPVVLLAADFAVRVFLMPRFSLLVLISRRIILPLAPFKNRMIVFQPKRFAAMIGLALSVAAGTLKLLDYAIAPAVILTVLGTFSALEAFLRFCAGCKIFGLLIKLGWADEKLCEDCVFTDGARI